jgi:agmatinase
MIDPTRRWPDGAKPEYAGLLSYGSVPYTEDEAELAGADAVIVGAPMDELVTDLPGTRLGPRGIRAASGGSGPHLEAGVDALEELRVVDFGDAPIAPADPVRSHAAIERTVAAVLGARAIPIVLGGDHSITEPSAKACAAALGPLGLVHFDAHTDTARSLYGGELSHGTPMYRLVKAGHVDPARYVQIGLRGYWPGPEEFGWQAECGIVSYFGHDVRERGIGPIVRAALAAVGRGPVYMTVDVDVLDPAHAPGTGTPEPGGLSAVDLLWACRELAAGLDLVGVDVVEVIPRRLGPADVTALVADRIVREALTGIALRRRGGPGADAAGAGSLAGR